MNRNTKIHGIPIIEFVASIEDDLIRRDFTINALAYSYSDDKLIDQCNPITDLSNKLLVCVGEPRRRFKEDTLRPYRRFDYVQFWGFVWMPLLLKPCLV